LLPFDTSCTLAEKNTGLHAFCLPSTEMLIQCLCTVQCIVLHSVVDAQLSVSVSITHALHKYCVTNTSVQLNFYHTLSNIIVRPLAVQHIVNFSLLFLEILTSFPWTSYYFFGPAHIIINHSKSAARIVSCCPYFVTSCGCHRHTDMFSLYKQSFHSFGLDKPKQIRWLVERAQTCAVLKFVVGSFGLDSGRMA